MTGRIGLIILALFAGAVAATVSSDLSGLVRRVLGIASGSTAAQLSPSVFPGADKNQGEGRASITLSPDQITAAGVEVTAVEPATLTRRITVPGTIIPHADKIARVSVKLAATVAELRKKIGDAVAEGEVIAVLESREVADAKSEYLAAKLTNELQQDLAERDKALWDKRSAPEQQYIRSRNLAALSHMRFDIARQKLLALGLSDREIVGLPEEPEALLRRQEVRSPMAGRVAERKVDIGTMVGRDNLETELFVIVDLERVWVDLAVSPADLALVKEGQPVTVTARAGDKGDGTIIFISPLLDKDSRAARVVAEIANPEGVWRPGSFVTAAIAIGGQQVPVAVPASAIQTLDGNKVVFVRIPEGFSKREVVPGRTDGRTTEIVAGLKDGETIAATNTFSLKSEFLKGQAED
jgi:cobalt-zinc-cadmium efflux system membrane fusion protein